MTSAFRFRFQFHDIILLSSENQFESSSSETADAESLICLLHLRNLIDKSQRPKTFSIVTEMIDIRNRQLAEITRADDFIVSPELLSKYIAQISQNKHLSQVFDVLLTAEGVEIYLRPVALFTKLGVPTCFRQILRTSLEQNTLAIGYRMMAYAQDPGRFYGIVLNPDKDQSIIFRHDDKVIVLAEE